MSQDDQPSDGPDSTDPGQTVRHPVSLLTPPVPDTAENQPASLLSLFGAARNPLSIWSGKHLTQDYVFHSGQGAKCSVALSHPDLVRQVLENRSRHYATFPGSVHCHDLVLSESMAAYPSLLPSMSQFASQALGRYFAAMEAEASLFADKLAASPPQEEIALAPLISEVVGGMIQRTLLGQMPETVSRSVIVTLEKSLNLAGIVDSFKYLDGPGWLPFVSSKAHQASQTKLRRLVGFLVSNRREKTDHRIQPASPDLVGVLLHAFRAAPDDASHDEAVTSITMAILSTCFATSQRTLVWALALLAASPEVQDDCAREAVAMMDDSVPLGTRLEEAVRIKSLIKETLRLYPPVPVIRRSVLADDNNHGVTIPKGSTVMIAPWVVHRHRHIWQNPDAFMPERFMEPATIPPYAFLPFGGGEQTCIGFGYMMLATRLVVLSILNQLEIRLWGNQTLPVPLQRIGLVPSSPISLSISTRSSPSR